MILFGADTKIIDTFGNNILQYANDKRKEVKELLKDHFNQMDSYMDCTLGIGLKPMVKTKTNFYLFIILHAVIWMTSFFCLLPC